jgi:hypothetical protein
VCPCPGNEQDPIIRESLGRASNLFLNNAMAKSSIRYVSFPLTEPPPNFAERIVEVFKSHESEIGTVHLKKGLTSDQALSVLREDLESIGFDVEQGKRSDQKIERPVFFGIDGYPTLRYQIDAFHSEWNCGLEIEAGRAVMGNAVYRDLVQALVMVQVDVLALAVPNEYKYKSSGRDVSSNDFEKTRSVCQALFGHSRIQFPYKLLLIGY